MSASGEVPSSRTLSSSQQPPHQRNASWLIELEKAVHSFPSSKRDRGPAASRARVLLLMHHLSVAHGRGTTTTTTTRAVGPGLPVASAGCSLSGEPQTRVSPSPRASRAKTVPCATTQPAGSMLRPTLLVSFVLRYIIQQLQTTFRSAGCLPVERLSKRAPRTSSRASLGRFLMSHTGTLVRLSNACGLRNWMLGRSPVASHVKIKDKKKKIGRDSVLHLPLEQWVDDD